MVSEKHLALLASTVSLVLATMSATALVMVNTVRSDLSARQETVESQTIEIQKLQAIVSQLKENQIALLPLIMDPGRRPVAGDQSAPADTDKSEPVEGGDSPQAIVSDKPKATLEHPATVQVATSSASGNPEQARKPAASVVRQTVSGPSAPTPAGVKVFSAADTQFVAPAPAAETGAPQASLTHLDDTILAALQTPTMGIKAHPVLDQIIEASFAKPTPSTLKPKTLDNVDSILVQRIIANWQRPASARNGMAVEVEIKMTRGGTVRSAKVVTSSGDKGFDTSAISAILGVKELPEMTHVSDATYNHLYKARRVRFSPEDLSG